MHKDTFVISGTFLEVQSLHPEAAKIVYTEFKRLDKIFNLHDPESELSRLNRTYNTPFHASDELIELISLSQQLSVLTQGAFDASARKLYSFWKEAIKAKKLKELPSARKIKELRANCGNHFIDIDRAKNTITINRQGLQLDLSAIAKGYMVDKAALRLKGNGITSALINAGGDVYCLGTDRSQPWQVGIRDPRNKKKIIDTVSLIDEAIATSGSYEQFFTHEGEQYSHLIDPRTGYPVANKVLSVSVVSQNCTTADGLATGFFILGIEGVKEFLNQQRSTMKIYVISEKEEGIAIHVFQ